MADNLTLNAGSGGATLATDDITDVGGAHYQRVKLTDGTANSETHIEAGNGTSANALRVTVASDSSGVLSVDDNGGSLTVDGTVTANLGATDNAVLDQIEVNTSYGDNTGGGAEAGVLRVTLANDSTGLLSVDDNGGSLTVDNSTLSVVGGGTEAAAMRVTLANDSTGVLSVDDNGGSLTVDNAGITTIAGAVSGSEMQVDVVASLPAGTNNIGDVDIASAIPAGTNVIGDVGISGARTSGGTTLYRNIDVDETEDSIKASGGQLYWIHAMNLTAAVLYLQLYNNTVASVTVGTTTPDLTFPIPTQGDTNGAGFVLAIPNGIAFSTAITIACTTTIGGSAGPAANGCVVNAGYA